MLTKFRSKRAPELGHQLAAMGFHLDQRDGQVETHCTLEATRRFVAAMPGLHAQADPWPTVKNEWHTCLIKPENQSFRGGTLKAFHRTMAGQLDMTPYEREKRTLSQSAIARKVLPMLQANRPRRVRYFSEHDGEWSYERRWELAPFQATRRTLANTRTLDCLYLFNFSGSVGTDAIAMFGAKIWALTQLIESHGIRCRITIGIDSRNTFTAYPEINQHVRIRIKEPGEYLAPSLLAATFSAAYFRRVILALIPLPVLAMDKGDCAYGLGTPIYGQPIEFKNGQLIISNEKLDDNLNALFESLQTALERK